MSDMWESLGFSQSPYDARPLRPVQEDEQLLVGRSKEAVEFCTTLESANEGIMVLSGQPGVGKTSFFNVQQYRLASEKAEFGPKVLPAERLCSIQPEDDGRAVALRVVENLVRSVQIYCGAHNKQVPKGTASISKWINSAGGSSFDLGVSILGYGGHFGRSVTLPGTKDVSFEGLQDAIECIASEAVQVLECDCLIIALDNIENLDDPQLANLLMTFRDTLFMVPRVWWVLIGQSGLGTLIQTLDTRVSDRLSGVGIELNTLPFDEVDKAISLRVSKFSKDGNTKSPLPTDIHKRLYDASHGEIRFVFRYSHEICTRFVQMIRQSVLGEADRDALYIAIADKLAQELVNDQIPSPVANALLRDIVVQEFQGLNLRPKEKKILRLLAEKKEARPKEYESFGCKSMQEFYSNYLSKMHSQFLLTRRQEGKAVFYKLRGMALIAYELGLIKNGS